MRKITLSVLLVLFLLAGVAIPGAGQAVSSGNAPRVGLVLSGGSAKGIAHVGVLKVLEEEGVPIDIITGTSVGAIAGGLYSIGFSTDQLERIFTGQDWERVFSDAVERRDLNLAQRMSGDGVLFVVPVDGTDLKIPGSMIAGQEMTALLNAWTWAYQNQTDLTKLPIPFSAIATDLRTGLPVALNGLPLALAIRASMSIPTLFPPVQFKDAYYVDGGLSRNLPARDAIDLNADFLIGVDVGLLADSVDFETASLVDILIHSAFYQGYRSDTEQRTLVDVLIRPDITGLAFSDFEHAREWVARGEKAARAALPRIRFLADSLGIPMNRRDRAAPDMKPKIIGSISIWGVNGSVAELVERRLDLMLPQSLGPDDVAAAVARVYGTGQFDLVSYRVIPAAGDTHELRIEATKRQTPDHVGLGVRYDTENDAQILFSLSLRNRFHFGSSTNFRLSLGKQSKVSAAHNTGLGAENRFTVGAEGAYASAPVQFFLPPAYATSLSLDSSVPVLSLGLDSYSLRLLSAYALSENALLTFAARGDLVRVRKKVAAMTEDPAEGEIDPLPGNTDDHSVLTFGVSLDRDTFDERAFPSTGMRLVTEGGIGLSNSDPVLVSPGTKEGNTFQYFRWDAEGYAAISSKISIFARTVFSYGSGSALPLSFYSFLGGIRPTTVLPGSFLPFMGLESQAKFGRKAYVGMIGIQTRIRSRLYARFIVNAGRTYDILVDNEAHALGAEVVDMLQEPTILGIGVEVGVKTPLGPASIMLGSRDAGKMPQIGVSAGYSF